jgi:hypothetical protein
MILKGSSQVKQVKVKWSELPDDLSIWADYDTLKQQFLAAPA